MSEERDTEQAGAPIEQAEATENQVLAAVERAAEVTPPSTESTPAGASSGSDPSASPAAGQAATPIDQAAPVHPNAAPSEPSAADHSTGAPISDAQPEGTERIAPVVNPPSAGAGESPAQIFQNSHSGAAGAAPVAAGVLAAPGVAAPPTAPQQPLGPGAPGAPLAQPLPPARDGEIRINADHPMAALYMQSPMPPEMRGNRGAGVLIALLATLAFAIVYAGVMSLWLAPDLPPSRFLSDGLLPWVLSWSFILSVVGFFIALTLLVLIVGRAGWWAYVLGGLLVAVLVWAVALAGFALDIYFAGGMISSNPLLAVQDFGLFFPIIAAALVAREVTVWFGGWIGARGRKVSRQNSEALAEYEAALAEVQAK